MKKLLILILLLAPLPLLCQSQDDEEIKPWKDTGWRFGLMPAMELSNGIFASPLTFSPDIVVSYKSNVVGFGPRIDGVGERNLLSSNSTEFGLGMNYLRYFRSIHKSFDFFSYYDFEYYHLDGNERDLYFNTRRVQASYYNMVVGFGYHLNFSEHLYLSQSLGIGISVKRFNRDQSYIDYREYSAKDQITTAILKVGIGYNF